MLVKTISQQCRRTVAQPYWSDFLDIFNDDYQRRSVTLHIIDEHEDDFQILRQTTLHSVNCESTPSGAQVSVTVSKDNEIYCYVVNQPRRIEVFYEQGNQIFAVAIVKDDKTRIVIYLEEEEVPVLSAPPMPMRSLFSEQLMAAAV